MHSSVQHSSVVNIAPNSLLFIPICSGPVCHRVVGGMVWNPVLQRSISSEYLETKSLPSRSPPTTPNWYKLQDQTHRFFKASAFISSLSSVCVLSSQKVLHSPVLSDRRSPRVRHGIRKPRPSSAELTNDLKDMSEGEDVFYTYRASVSSSKDSEGDAASRQLVSFTTEMTFTLYAQSLSHFIGLCPSDACWAEV